MQVHKVDPNNLPGCEVLAFNKYNVEDAIMIGKLFKLGNRVHCQCLTRTRDLGGITHYIHLADLFNFFKSEADGNSKD